MQDGDGDRWRYKAFISYAHADEESARWLQKKLESYRVPKRLRQAHPELPKRLFPVFRDRDELASGNDLSQAICDAMAESAALVVICSPAAAASRWVNEEIRKFRSQPNGQRIYCLIVDGSPERDSPDCAFPRALLEDDQGQPLPEPLAADLTPGADGPRGALIKIAAGLLEVGVDDLRQRDAQRQVRFWSAVAAGSVAVALLTIGLAIMTWLAQQESELRRGQAENLIGFMLGDLRDKLEPLGRLDLLDSVGDQATSYFAALGGRGSDEEIMARAMALRQIGEVRFSQGQLDPALEAFDESRKVARALSEDNPENENYLFELGQAEFWVGYVAWERRDLDGADQAFQIYQDISNDLQQRAPSNEDYLLESLYAASNLGSVALERGQPQEAQTYFQQAIDLNREMLLSSPGDGGLQFELANSLSWMASAQLDAGELAASQETSMRANVLLSALHERGERARHSEEFADNALILAQLQLHRGLVSESMESSQLGLSVLSELASKDPDNARWKEALEGARWRVAELHLLLEQGVEAEVLLATSVEGLRALHAADVSDLGLQQRLALAETSLAQLRLQQGSAAEALELVNNAMGRTRQALAARSATAKQLREAVSVTLFCGDVLTSAGEVDAGTAAWAEGMALLSESTDRAPLPNALRASLYRRMQQHDQAHDLAEQLLAQGFQDPRFK